MIDVARSVIPVAFKLNIDCRFVYWTDTRSSYWKGQVWRMLYDGSGKELVFDKLSNPHAITVDHASMIFWISMTKVLSCCFFAYGIF